MHPIPGMPFFGQNSAHSRRKNFRAISGKCFTRFRLRLNSSLRRKYAPQDGVASCLLCLQRSRAALLEPPRLKSFPLALRLLVFAANRTTVRNIRRRRLDTFVVARTGRWNCPLSQPRCLHRTQHASKPHEADAEYII